MNVEYRDGLSERLNGQTPEQVAAMLRRMTDPFGDVQAIESWRENKDESGPYPNNRAGRRKWAAERRRNARKGK